jgi:hypothetical protein
MTRSRLIVVIVLAAFLGWFAYGLYASARQTQLNTRLVTAVDSLDVRAVRRLLAAGADPNTRKGSGQTPSWRGRFAALFGRASEDKRFLGTPVLQIAGNGSDDKETQSGIEIVTLLLAKGADVNARNDIPPKDWDVDGPIPRDTALLNATSHHQRRTVTILLNAHADIDAKDVNGETALSYAAPDDPALVEILVDHRANVDSRDGAGETALILAAEFAQPDSVRTLIAHGADVNARDKDGHTALWLTRHNADVHTIIKQLQKERQAQQVTAILLKSGAAE